MYKQFLNEQIDKLENVKNITKEDEARLEVYKQCLNNYDMFKTLEKL